MWRENAAIGNLRVNSLTIGGVPAFGGGVPHFGNTIFVDGTYGSDGAGGLSAKKPLKTIQAAITQQIARTRGRGDVIYVLPGTYAEALTRDLTGCSLVGALPHAPNAVEVKPTTGSAYRGALNKSCIRNMSLRRSSTDNTTYAALSMPTMVDSVVENCQIVGGGSDVATSTGLRIGTEATSVAYENMARSRIAHCNFTHRGNMSYNNHYGIVFGTTGNTDSSKNATRQFIYSEICYNRIFAEVQGIQLNMGGANGSGASIHHNVVGSPHNNGNCSNHGISFTENDDQLIKVYENYVSGSDAIYGFHVGNVYGNYVSAGAATPTRELPAGA